MIGRVALVRDLAAPVPGDRQERFGLIPELPTVRLGQDKAITHFIWRHLGLSATAKTAGPAWLEGHLPSRFHTSVCGKTLLSVWLLGPEPGLELGSALRVPHVVSVGEDEMGELDHLLAHPLGDVLLAPEIVGGGFRRHRQRLLGRARGGSTRWPGSGETSGAYRPACVGSATGRRDGRTEEHRGISRLPSGLPSLRCPGVGKGRSHKRSPGGRPWLTGVL
ncbi:hypothetical protein PG994_003041 [Apiospora phragmitis]|uniref:Uncharacterized protein n=1 Tax=Apiospora phragmitis TaxID=2905665 RepID=A0ABR1WAN8_9PEZI